MNFLLHDNQRRYTLRPSCHVYECHEAIPADAKSVPVESYPEGGSAIRVRVGERVKVAKRIGPEQVKPGERVLISLVFRDLLSLFVATAEA